MVRTPRYKYVLYEAGAHREMLFDMDSNRLEMTNLAVEVRYADVLRLHRDLLRQWMQRNLRGEAEPSVRFIPD